MCVFFTAIGTALQPEKGLGPDVPGVYFIGDLSFIVKRPKGKSFFLTSESAPFSQHSEVVKPHVHGRSGGDSWGCGTT